MLESNPDVKLIPAARGTLLALAMFAAGMGGLTYQLFTKRPKA